MKLKRREKESINNLTPFIGKKRALALQELRREHEKNVASHSATKHLPKNQQHILHVRNAELAQASLVDLFNLQDENGFTLADELLAKAAAESPTAALKFLENIAKHQQRDRHHSTKPTNQVFAPVIITTPDASIDNLTIEGNSPQAIEATPTEDKNTLKHLLSAAKDVVNSPS